MIDFIKSKKVPVGIICVVLAVIAVVSIIVAVFSGKPSQKLINEKFELARKYQTDYDYVNAIKEYEEILELKPDFEGVYIRLMDVYIARAEAAESLGYYELASECYISGHETLMNAAEYITSENLDKYKKDIELRHQNVLIMIDAANQEQRENAQEEILVADSNAAPALENDVSGESDGTGADDVGTDDAGTDDAGTDDAGTDEDANSDQVVEATNNIESTGSDEQADDTEQADEKVVSDDKETSDAEGIEESKGTNDLDKVSGAEQGEESDDEEKSDDAEQGEKSDDAEKSDGAEQGEKSDDEEKSDGAEQGEKSDDEEKSDDAEKSENAEQVENAGGEKKINENIQMTRAVPLSLKERQRILRQPSNAGRESNSDLSKAKVGDIVYWGAYDHPKDDEGSVPLEWDVLAVSDNRVLLISHYILTDYAFDQSELYDSRSRNNWNFISQQLEDINWADSEIRAYLNNDFLDKLFSPLEQERIQTVVNKNHGSSGFYKKYNPDYWFEENTKSCTYTQDKMFLLSWEEVIECYGPLEYGNPGNFKWDYWYTENAIATYRGKTGGSWWWMRSPGYLGKIALYVGGTGFIDTGDYVCNYVGVRPAIYVSF